MPPPRVVATRKTREVSRRSRRRTEGVGGRRRPDAGRHPAKRDAAAPDGDGPGMGPLTEPPTVVTILDAAAA
jgi:hypothetical protein